MTSQINPNNINGAYPVAGQDNNSQGFRDNFTNTKTNFQYAAQEITELQSKAVLKAPLTGSVLDNNMLGAIISNAQVQGISGTVVNLGTVGGSVNIDFAAGPYQALSTNAPISLAFSNWPTAGTVGVVTVKVTITNTAHTLTLPSAVSINAIGIPGYRYDTGTISFAATGVFSFTFTTSNNGSTIIIDENNKELAPLTAGYDVVANGGIISMAVSTTTFAPTGSWVSTLPDGVNGLVKTLVQTVAGASMVVTVTHAGWKIGGGSGTISFDNIGDSCLLQFMAGKWYCISNNNSVFA